MVNLWLGSLDEELDGNSGKLLHHYRSELDGSRARNLFKEPSMPTVVRNNRCCLCSGARTISIFLS